MKRYVRGVLKGVSAEFGTLLGPNDLGEYMVVLSTVDGGVEVGFAQTGDADRASRSPEPRSVTEGKLWATAGRMRLSRVFGSVDGD